MQQKRREQRPPEYLGAGDRAGDQDAALLQRRKQQRVGDHKGQHSIANQWCEQPPIAQWRNRIRMTASSAQPHHQCKQENRRRPQADPQHVVEIMPSYCHTGEDVSECVGEGRTQCPEFTFAELNAVIVHCSSQLTPQSPGRAWREVGGYARRWRHESH